MRFIHTADIHLDSPLTGLSAYADAPVAQLRTATRDAFDGLVGAALRAERRLDFDLTASVQYALEIEPTVMALSRRRPQAWQRHQTQRNLGYHPQCAF